MKYFRIMFVLAITLAIVFAGCSLPEKLNAPEPVNNGEPGPPATLALSKAGVVLSGNTQLYAGFTSPRDSWQALKSDGYSVPTVVENYFGLRSGTTANDSMLVEGVEVVTEKGRFQMAHYSTTINGSFFSFRPLPDGSVDCPRGLNLNQIIWVQIGTDSSVSKSTLDNWIGTGSWVRLPMIKGSVARCWVDRAGKGVTDVLVTTHTSRTGGTKISELRPTHWVKSGDGWVLEFATDPSGVLVNTGSDNTTITIHP